MARSMVRLTLTVLVWCEFAIGQFADTRFQFDAASVKPAPPKVAGDSTPRGGPGTSDPGQFTYERTVLRNLVADAYAVWIDQVSGPDWTNTEAYSIVARIPPSTTKDQFHLMLQNLLAERFHLAIHRDTKTVPVYVLSVAPGGPKWKPASADPNAAAAPPTCDARAENRFPGLRPGRSEAHQWCPGMAYYTYRQTMSEFALGLGTLVSMSNGDGIIRGGPPAPFVIDETGITGRFEFTLEFAGSIFPSSPAQVAALMASGAIPSGAPPEKIAGNDRGGGPNLFSALEKQLGLKLEKSKRPMGFLVIDHADRVPNRELSMSTVDNHC